MEGSEGTSQAELYTGWSSVVHQPCEDLEESELPSTVDIAAFSSSLSVDPSNTSGQTLNAESDSDSEADSSNSGSEASHSGSQTDSSESDSSSSSQGSTSRSSSPAEFSVTSSQTDGLRLTIATVKKPCGNLCTEKTSLKSLDTRSHSSSESVASSGSENDSPCSNDNKDAQVKSKSESNKESPVKKNVNKVVTCKASSRKVETTPLVKKDSLTAKVSKVKAKSKAGKKMSSLGRDCTYCSSDGEAEAAGGDGDESAAMLASCSLQEIRQEDLAAILPDQQECDAFGSFERDGSGKNGAKKSPEADMSDSDMELPHQAVNALIQRTTESSSESDHEFPNPPTLYANSLLQQFEAQTQMLSTQLTTPVDKKTVGQGTNTIQKNRNEERPSNSEKSKRRRGRPKKNTKSRLVTAKSAYNVSPNVSPDSGIQNSPDHISSPEPTLLRNQVPKEEVKLNEKKVNSSGDKEKVVSKLTTDRLDRHFYGHSERTLYPPKRKTSRLVTRKDAVKRQVENLEKPQKVEDKVQNNKSEKNVRERKSRSNNESAETKPNEVKSNNTNNETKKSKSSFLFEICERVSKRLEIGGKASQKPPLTTHNTNNKVQKNCKHQKNHRSAATSRCKLEPKCKVATLKHAKVMHSKHQHKIHKKRKFKILKPLAFISQDPKINTEIEKLIADFMKLCISNNLKPTKENVPEILKTLKRVSKKRKTSEYERKKKKQSVSMTVNKIENSEQRLPLKKRHYHISATENKIEDDKDVSKESEENKNNKAIPTKQTLPTKGSSPRSQNNNNDYDLNGVDSKNVNVHIDEAIEACINRFSDGKKDSPTIKVEEKTNVSTSSITATTPKKRHRLAVIESMEADKVEHPVLTEKSDVENAEIAKKSKVASIESVVTELKMKRNLSPKTAVSSKNESVAQMITRKKNRLEDLTSNLVSKINPSFEVEKKKKDVDVGRASVIKYPVCKKAKPTELERLDTITSAKPTGIFMPTVDLDLIVGSDAVKSEKKEEIGVKTEEIKDEPKKEVSSTVPSTNQEAEKTPPDTGKKKVRKRRAPNRTGFPTLKKKKKKNPPNEVDSTVSGEPKACDRVPVDGEEYTSFVNRTENGNLSAVLNSSTSSHVSPKCKLSDDPNSLKWETMSECESLPQDERTELDLDEFKLGPDYSMRDDSPTTSIDTRDSDKTRREVDLDDLPIGQRLEMGGRQKRGNFLDRQCRKRRLRDHSSASSGDRKLSDDRSTSGEERKNKKVPKWKKRYLVAGLFSDYYKEGDDAARRKRMENSSKSSKTIYVPAEHPYGLLPPPYHCGKYLRCRNVPFQLPYDLWWQHTHSQLPGRDVVPSWNYRKIRTNVYNVKTTGTACELQTCNCTPAQKCGDDCINRLVLSECPANIHRCQNQKIQRHEWAPGLEKFMTENKGWGVRTKLPIKSNEFILEYVGEVVSDQEFKERMASIYVNDTHHYCLHLDTGMVIDGHRMGGDGRFVNHSCEPNCEMQKWSVNGQFRMALFALRDIEADEELTYDYNFSLFNPADGQECKCGSEMCRGVIGGKSQRVRQLPALSSASRANGGRVGRPRKITAAKKSAGGAEVKEMSMQQEQHQMQSLTVPIQVKPISHQQKCYILEHHCFLLRNINKVRKVKDRAVGISFVNRPPTALPQDHGTAFLNHLNALQKPRNMKTRRIAQAEDNPDFNRSVRIASVLKDIYNSVVNFKGENDTPLAASFMTLPSKRKLPEFYQMVSDPMDFTSVEQNIAKGAYRTTDSFDNDMNRVLQTFTKFHGRSSEQGIAAARLKKAYQESKRESLRKFEDLVGTKPPPTFVSKRNKNEEEDIIRCICGMYHDEGLMIQCERCLVWQHCECVRADPAAPSYHCEKCVPREVDLEIPMDEFTEHGHRYYLTLIRGDLQLRQGDTAYVLRDIPIPGTDQKHTYKTIGKMDFNDLDIFRIERLWKDCKTGQRFAYGHHYLRPHETYHEPTRKFFPNEVMRVPLYEAVPVELIISQCWVLDLNTYCKGRPIGADEDHVYICEYRVDKSARLFHKISRTKYTVCTKSYVFERFAERLKVSRTYTPHELNNVAAAAAKTKPARKTQVEKSGAVIASEPPVVLPPRIKDPNEQKSRLNKILLKLLSKMPTKQPLDVSYLLEGGRRRKNKMKSNQ
ncbi:hypothetical protein HHI36_011919 [Cryptolaemus montrouzieri]|uniref:Histone-lysine N-methyltransferase ash1 n=1 Tax=Cryptolaemus montrouzieri TaxID=559131 RepID=A0ABD2NDS5_9CUCU